MDSPGSGAVLTYVWAIIALSVAAILGVVGVNLFRSGDNTAITAAIIGVATPPILSLLALISRENHMAVNSRLDQFVNLTRSSARAEGVLEGRDRSETDRATG